MEITKQGAKSLHMEIAKCLYLKEAAVITPCSRLQQNCPNRFRSLEDRTDFSGSSRSTGEKIRTSFQLITHRVSDGTKLLRFTSLR